MTEGDDELTYDVGFGKPPKESQFRKGVSGNSRGRPKGSPNFKTILARSLREKVMIIKDNGTRKVVTKFESAVQLLVNKAAPGDFRALHQLTPHANSAEQTVEISTKKLSDVDAQIFHNFVKGSEDLTREKMMTVNDPEYQLILRNDFGAFAEKSFHELNPATNYAHNWHLEIIAAALEQCRAGKLKRVIINLPP